MRTRGLTEMRRVEKKETGREDEDRVTSSQSQNLGGTEKADQADHERKWNCPIAKS